MTAPEFDRLAAACPRPWCRQPSGAWCVTAGRTPAGRLHAPRVALSLALAAHADPLLLPWFPGIGQCQICGVKGLDQQHRVIDSIAGWLDGAAADPQTAEVLADDPAALDGELAAEFGVTEETVAVVRAWAERWPGAW